MFLETHQKRETPASKAFAAGRAATDWVPRFALAVAHFVVAFTAIFHVMRMDRLYTFYYVGDAEAVTVSGALLGCVVFAITSASVSHIASTRYVSHGSTALRYAACAVLSIVVMRVYERAALVTFAGPDVSGFDTALPSNLKVYVLTLNSSASLPRRVSVSAQLERENVRFEYYYGVMFKDYPDLDSVVRATGYRPLPDLKQFEETYARHMTKKLSFGDVGVDYVIYRQLRETYEAQRAGDPAVWVLLMEDDVGLYPDFAKRVNYALQTWPDVDGISLDNRGMDDWLTKRYPTCGFGAVLFKISSVSKIIAAIEPESEDTLEALRRGESFVSDRRFGHACRDGKVTCGFTPAVRELRFFKRMKDG